MAGVIDHLAEQMESLQTMFIQSDISRSMVDEKLGKLADSMDRMTLEMQGQSSGVDALDRIVSGQDRMIEVIEKQAIGDGIDAESRMRLRSIDVQMLRILEEISAGRQETMAELRTDIASLAQALSQPRGQSRKIIHGSGPGKQGQTEGDS